MPQCVESRNSNTERLLIERLSESGLPGTERIAVRVRCGVTHIEGFVANFSYKKLIGHIAAQVDGIDEVVNMLRVAPVAVVDDESTVKRIRLALARNLSIDTAKVSVTVANGSVWLCGSVKSAREKCIVEDEAWATLGVRIIINRLEVSSAMIKSIIQIEDDISQGLSQCLGIDSSKMAVRFRDGAVYLSGEVPTDQLRSAAEELACWTPSVTHVVNDLRVIHSPGSKQLSMVE